MNGFICHVYAIGCSCAIDGAPWRYAVKVGRARDPKTRLAGLQIGNPAPLNLLIQIPFVDRLAAADFETRFHAAYDHERIAGEWFAMSADRAVAAVELFLSGKVLQDG